MKLLIRIIVAFLLIQVLGVVAIAISGHTYPQALAVGSGFFLLSLLLFFNPGRISWLGGRVFAVFLAFFCTLLPVLAVTASKDEQRLLALRKENPALYLAELKAKDEGSWFTELKKLDPQGYKKEVDERQYKATKERLEKRKAALLEKSEKERSKRKKQQDKAERKKQKSCSDESINLSMAYSFTRGFVKDKLRSPQSAKFPSYAFSDGVQVSKVGECSFRVRSYVDSQNGFGAMIRTHYKAQVRNNYLIATWTLEELEFLE